MKPDFSFVTYSGLAQLDPDDRLVVDHLTKLGYTCKSAVWDDPSIDWSHAGTCVIRSTWDYHLNAQAFEKWISHVSSQTRLLNDPSLLRWNMHKHYIADLAGCDVATVPTIFCRAGETIDIADVMQRNEWTEAVAKPVIGLATYGVKRFSHRPDSLNEAQQHVNQLLKKCDVMLQPFMPSVQTHGERALVFIDGEFSHAVRKSAFQVLAVAGRAGESPVEATQAERELGYKALSHLESKPLYARVDVVHDKEELPNILELELIEPSLFLAMSDSATERFAEALLKIHESR
jgi:glutathione synthase/RimK-type ligase-like ATP-grasp enzyme